MKLTCKHCGKAFEGEAVHFGAVLFCPPEYCSKDCGDAAYSAFLVDRHAAERNRTLELCIPPIYRATDPKRLPCNPRELARLLAWRPINGRGLIVPGTTGRGKTRAVCLWLKDRILRDGWTPTCCWAGEVERAITGLFDSRGGYDKLFASMAKCSLLFWDDFGKDRFSDRYESFVFQVLDYRITHMLPTVLTTNATGASLAARFSDAEKAAPFIRRLGEFFDAVEL